MEDELGENPSAFPPNSYQTERGVVEIYDQGMSLRDYFAAKALAGIMVGGTKGDPIDSLADLSYKMADAMLKARQKI